MTSVNKSRLLATLSALVVMVSLQILMGGVWQPVADMTSAVIWLVTMRLVFPKFVFAPAFCVIILLAPVLLALDAGLTERWLPLTTWLALLGVYATILLRIMRKGATRG